MRNILLTLLMLFALALFVMAAHFYLITAGLAHSFYDYECCSDNDCAPYKGEVTETDKGYQLQSGPFVPYGDKRIRTSPDTQFHACILGGTLICLYAPGRGT